LPPKGDLHGDIRRLDAALRTEMRSKWARDLPLDELLFDRWARAASLGFGPSSSIYQNSYVYGDVSVGAGTWIGPLTVLDGSGGLQIGSNCSISAGVQVYTHDTVRRALSGGIAPIERQPVQIGNACHVGANAVILPGVTIGEHSVIGAGAVVTESVPAYHVAAGVPCRLIGKVEVDADGGVRLTYDRDRDRP